MRGPALVIFMVSATACPPATPDDTATATTGTATAGTSTTGTSTTTGSTTGTLTTTTATTGTTAAVDPDTQLCEQWCAAIVASGCSSGCGVETCVDTLHYVESEGCGAEHRAMLMCEATETLDFGCESRACAPEYLVRDVCFGGECTRLGAIGTASASDTLCSWGAETCYGHTLDMQCPPTPDAQCDCVVDGQVNSSCALGADLAPQVCGDFKVFTGCCTDVFVEAILEP